MKNPLFRFIYRTTKTPDGQENRESSLEIADTDSGFYLILPIIGLMLDHQDQCMKLLYLLCSIPTLISG